MFGISGYFCGHFDHLASMCPVLLGDDTEIMFAAARRIGTASPMKTNTDAFVAAQVTVYLYSIGGTALFVRRIAEES
jgi:hypothetical protein